MIPRIILILITLFFYMAPPLYAQDKERGPYDPELANAVQGLGKKYALLIGVEYDPPYTLDWTARDAEMIANTLKGVYGFDTTLLIGAENTTREATEKIPNNKSQITNKFQKTNSK